MFKDYYEPNSTTSEPISEFTEALIESFGEPTIDSTREAYLMAGIEYFREAFKMHGHPLPDKMRVSCSWTLFHRKGSIGECFSKQCSRNGYVEIFISPTIDDSKRVLGILLHEIIHSIPIHGHGKDFRLIAEYFGLTGHMTATVNGTVLDNTVFPLFIADYGEYPHSQVNYEEMRRERPKEGTRLIKIACPKCGYTCRTTRKWIEESGLPTCPCGNPFEIA